jgi:tetratricopeptide (TPR) repeat protein
MEEASRSALEVDLSKVDEETREKLAALGYIGSFTDSSKLRGKTLADPKDKISVFNRLAQARESGLGGEPEEAIKTIRAIIAEDPGISDAHFSLGNIYYKSKRYEEALEAFEISLDLKPDDSFAVINIANALQALGRSEEAERFVLDRLARGLEDPQLYFLLGNVRVRRGDPDGAVPYFEQCLAANPQSASAHNAIAAIYLNKDRLEEAEAHLKAASAISPRLTSLRFNRATLLEKRGQLAEAADLYGQEIQDSPRNYRALFNLSRVYRLTGREDDELAALRRTIEAEPDFPVAYFYLARINLRRGQDYDGSIALVQKGIELKPSPSELPLGYFLLADLYNRVGDNARSAEYARLGQRAAEAAKARAKG